MNRFDHHLKKDDPKKEAMFFGIGRKLNISPLRRAEKIIEKEREHGFKPYIGELKKTRRHIRMIELANEYIQKEGKAHGIEKIPSIPPQQIHFLGKRAYQILEGKQSVGTYAQSRREEITLAIEDATEPYELFRIITHEIIHAVSFGKYGVVTDSLERVKTIKATRIGYFNVSQNEESSEYFRYFNEAIVEQVAIEITKRQKEFPIPVNAYLLGAYMFPRHILVSIVKKVAAFEDEEYKTIWRRFKQGLFTGEMMHLRCIERVYGKRALRILSQLEEDVHPPHTLSGDEKKKYTERAHAMKYFFQEENPAIRDRLADTIQLLMGNGRCIDG